MDCVIYTYQMFDDKSVYILFIDDNVFSNIEHQPYISKEQAYLLNKLCDIKIINYGSGEVVDIEKM